MVDSAGNLDLEGIEADIELMMPHIAAKFASDGPVHHLQLLEQRQGKNIRTQIEMCAKHSSSEINDTGIIMAGCLAQMTRAKLHPKNINDWTRIIYATTVLIMNSREVHKHL